MARVRNKDGGIQSKGKGVTRGSYAFKKLEAPAGGLAPSVTWRNQIDEIASHWGEGFLPDLNDRMERSDAGGYTAVELGLVRAQFMGSRGDWTTGIDENTGARLHELGFTSIPKDWAPGMSPDRAAKHGYTAARCTMALEYLKATGEQLQAGNHREFEALRDAPEELLRAVIDQGGERHEMRVNLLEAQDPGYKARHADFTEHGFDVNGKDRDLVDFAQLTGAQARSIRNALPEVNPWQLNALAERGFTGEHLKTYGMAACEGYTTAELDSGRIPVKTMRSYVSFTRSMPIPPSYETLAELHDAGHTDGRTVRKYLDITGAEDNATGTASDRVRYLADRATPEQVTHFTEALQRFRAVRDEDLPAIARVVAAGYTTTSQVQEFWGRAPDGYRDLDFTHTVDALDKAVRRGFTAAQARAYAGAGMPVSKIDRHAPGEDFWKLGAEHRTNPAWTLTKEQWQEQYSA